MKDDRQTGSVSSNLDAPIESSQVDSNQTRLSRAAAADECTCRRQSASCCACRRRKRHGLTADWLVKKENGRGCWLVSPLISAHLYPWGSRPVIGRSVLLVQLTSRVSLSCSRRSNGPETCRGVAIQGLAGLGLDHTMREPHPNFHLKLSNSLASNHINHRISIPATTGKLAQRQRRATWKTEKNKTSNKHPQRPHVQTQCPP